MENDYQQQQFDIGAITYDEEPFAEATTSASDVDDLSDVAAMLERDQSFDSTAADEESSTIQTPISVNSAAVGFASDSLAQELATIPPLPLDDDFQDVYSTSATDESITLVSDVLQDVTTIAPVFETISSTGDHSVDPEIVTLPYSTVADILEATTHEILIDDEEITLLSSNPITDPPPASDDLPAAAITFVATASSADDLSLITPATAMTDVLTEIQEIPTQIQQLEYSSFGPNEEEGEEDGENIISLMAVKNLPDELTRAEKERDEPHQSVSHSADEEAYPVSGPSSKETMIMTATASNQPLTNNIGENPPLATTEASAPTHHQSTLTDGEPSSNPILDFPLFYPSRIEGTVPPAVSVPDPLPALNPVSLRWPSAIVATSESFPAAADEADDQQLLTHDERGQPELEQNKRPQFYTSRPAHNKFKSSVGQDYPEVPNTFYHHPFSPSVVQPINHQSRYRQQQLDTSLHGPPRAPYPHPQQQHENKGDDSPFYRPFNSAPPKPRRLIFPPISNTRENFRFRVNWSDELGRSDWA